MQLYYVFTKLKYDGHRSLIVCRNKPNWFERLLLGRQTEVVHFIGRGQMWNERDQAKKLLPITNKTLIKRLQAIEAGVIQDARAHRNSGKTLKEAAIK